jgi:hypothetical protein
MNRPALAALALVCATISSRAQDFSTDFLARRTVERRAVEAVIWGIPAVNYESMVRALARAKGDFNQIVYWSRPSDWKNQTLTPITDVLYVIPIINTKTAGPMVLEIPPSDDGVIEGSITDIWQKDLGDLGPAGVDRGKGGKYVVLPPNYNDKIPEGYIAFPSVTYESYAMLRSVPASGSDNDVVKAASYLKRIKLYPLSRAGDPPPTKFVDATNVIFDATIPYDLRFFQSLDRIVQVEPWLERDKAMIDTLRSIGIEKGKPFKPDRRTQEFLKSAAQQAHAWLLNRFLNEGSAYYPREHWRDIFEPFAIKSAFSFETPVEYDTDMRGVLYYWARSTCRCVSERDGPLPTEAYLITHRDRDGRFFEGANTYRLHVPPNVPARHHWSPTVYDVTTHALIRDVPWGSRSSLTPGLQKNADGSVDIYFGPKAPAGKESNWIPTKPGGSYEVIFRFYGPEQAALDKTWRLPDIEEMTSSATSQ